MKQQERRLPLHHDAKTGNVILLREEMALGWSPNEKDDTGRTPLHYAFGIGNPDMIQALIDKGAQNTITDNHGFAPNSEESINSVRQLVFKIDQNADEEEMTALHRAAKKGDLQMVRTLINFGTTPDVKDNGGRTPLHYASTIGSSEMVKWLIENGASPEEPDKFGNTPLHLASRMGNLCVVKELIAGIQRADNTRVSDYCNVQNHDGITPLHFATRVGIHNTDVASVLSSNGADVMIQDDFSFTPLDHAREKGLDLKVFNSARSWASRSSSPTTQEREGYTR